MRVNSVHTQEYFFGDFFAAHPGSDKFDYLKFTFRKGITKHQQFLIRKPEIRNISAKVIVKPMIELFIPADIGVNFK